MSKKTVSLLCILLTASVILSACSLPSLTAGGIPTTLPEVDAQATQDALVAEAAQGTATQMALEQQNAVIVTQTPQPEPSATATEEVPPTETQPPATDTPSPTATPAFTETPAPTQTPVVRILTPTRTQTPVLFTAQPAASATPVPCNGARFVRDITVRDGTIFAANTAFTKTWLIKNTGTCTWNSGYDIIFVDGNRMGAPTVLDLPTTVGPGQEVEISIGMVAPSQMGNYKGNWKLRDDKGMTFGVGNNAPFYVEIIVNTSATVVPRDYVYDFAAEYCRAEWTNASTSTTTTKLPCPGTEGDVRGFVLHFDRPQLETGQIDDEPGLILNPQAITDGVLRGKYPAIKVEQGDHFFALVGCDYSARSCDVKVQVDYQIDNGAVQTLWSGTEKNDGEYTSVEIDLSPLAGKEVKFILTVMANGQMVQDRSLWLAPRIDRR